MIEHEKNLLCARDFCEQVRKYRTEEDFLKFLCEWRECYGSKRCLFVLACTIVRRKENCFSEDTKAIIEPLQAALDLLNPAYFAYILNGTPSEMIEQAVQYIQKTENA